MSSIVKPFKARDDVPRNCRFLIGVKPGGLGVATRGGDFAPSLGGRKKFSMTSFRKRFPF